ncbi:MAG: bifunctional UDP-N-acetylglucosamine diphosphorylase/glucosamine-1-phosphate N-acetyltransferase GlmU [Elusimicrobia bacterium]|nr:bifunctional UDP-N-acetylglucosamine diphosphorylase/glucosamine-1-phosphate N-acetyltransferase GlmU [Elusimicrobiota bacterium]
MKQNKLAVIILAAGEGTRMKSAIAKVAHRVAGRSLVSWVVAAAKGLNPAEMCLIVGHKADQVRAVVAGEKIGFAVQKNQRGSGHAVLQCAPRLGKFQGDILVLCADTPLITTDTLRSFLTYHRTSAHAVSILSAEFGNPFGYGRIVRRADGSVQGIVEEKDATGEQRKIREINSGIYCFSSPAIWQALKKIKPDNAKKEYYLTDVIEILNNAGQTAGACSLGVPTEILGVNTRVELAQAERLMNARILRRHMLNGVTIIDPDTTYISPDARIGADTVIYPGTVIEGATVIGERCVIKPHSVLTDARVDADALIGPFAHLRAGSVLKAGAKVGNFSEIKKSVIGPRSKVNHLSYIGDAILGADVNVGAGTITCNYDGEKKHTTTIGDRVFVGSNTNLVAPVTVGADAVIGAGSTITDAVPARSLALARARQINKAEYRKKRK